MSDNVSRNELSTDLRLKQLKKAEAGEQNLLARRERLKAQSMTVPKYTAIPDKKDYLISLISIKPEHEGPSHIIDATKLLEFDEPPSLKLGAAEEEIISIARENLPMAQLKTYTEDQMKIINNGKKCDRSGCSTVTTFLFELFPYLEKTAPDIPNQNIISHYGLCRRNDDSLFLILEATENGNISSYMEKNEVDGKTLLLWFLDIARGLNFLHKLDILFGELCLENVFVYGCHAKLEHLCVVNPGGIKMSPSIWEKTAEVYKFADLIQQALSKLLYKPQIRQEKFDNNLECCLEDYLAMLASHIKKTFLLNINPEILSTSTPGSILQEQVIVQTPEKQETKKKSDNSIKSIMEALCNMGNIVSYLEERLVNKSINLVRENPPLEIIPNIPIKSEDELKLQTEEESTEDWFLRVRSMQEGCFYTKLNIPRDEQEFINEYKEQILSLPLGDEIDECPTKRLAISKNTTKAWLINHSNKENFALAKFNCEYIMQPKYFLTDSLDSTRVTGILYEDAPLGNVKKFIQQRISDGRPVSDQEVLTWGLHLITAVKYLHNKNILHRDICPSHVFVYEINGEFSLKLGGLSFPKEVDAYCRTANHLWTSFSALEILQNDEYSCSSDIYSFGMMLYYMSHECKPMFPPKEERSRTALRRYLLSGQRPKLRTALDEDLAKVITACWVNESKHDKESTIEQARPTANIIYDWLRSNEY